MNHAIQAVAERYGLTTCPPPQKFISTGIPALDAVTGGVPKGRIVDIHGGEDAGKTALALAMAKGSVLYIDAENKLDPHMIHDLKNFYIAHLETLEDALEVVRIATKAFDSIVLDTIEALPMKSEPWDCVTNYHKPHDDRREKLLSTALPALIPILLSNHCTLILVNQMRNIPGVMYGKPDHSAGGKALLYYAFLRLEVNRIDYTKKGQTRTGQKIRVCVSKNRCGHSRGAAELTIDYSKGALS